MATLLRRRDEHDENNEDLETNDNVSGEKQPIFSADTTLKEPGSKIWGPYLELADKYDKDLVHNWRDDMDSLLIFAALFSASVTAFVIESYKTLVQDSGDVTVDVLLQISRQLANVTEASIRMRPPFQPGSTDIAINVFWFLSLAFSLACALAAVLVRQWARQYLRFPRSFSSTTEQARARQFLFENMEWWRMEVVVETIPALLHISLILFFVGLLLFAHSISVTLAVYLLCFSLIGGAAYTFISITPLIFPGCPYKTPFSAFIGLAVHRALPILEASWRFATIFLACLIFFLSSTLLALVRLISPSASIEVWKWPAHVSRPLRSECSRLLDHARVVIHSSMGLWAITRVFSSILRNTPIKVTVAVLSSWTSAVSSLHSAFHSASKSFVDRQNFFRNELSTRDAHALRWAMEFSKKDVDIFTIIASIPEFVQIHDANVDVRFILWNSGINSQTQRLLHSSSKRNSAITHMYVVRACLESIIWSNRCATYLLDEESTWIGFGTALTNDLALDIIETQRQVQLSDKDEQTFDCTLSNLLLRWIYLLENWVLAQGEDGFRQNLLVKWNKTLPVLLRNSWRIYGPFPNRAYLDVFKLDWSTAPRMFVCQVLRELRTAMAWQLLHHSFRDIELSLSFDATIWNSLFDASTHLPPFPTSTPEGEEGIFMLVNGSLRASRIGLAPFGTNLMDSKRVKLLLQTYSQVIPLHGEFISRVQVCHGRRLAVQKLGRTVEIPFNTYCAVIEALASAIAVSLLERECQPSEARPSAYSTTCDDLMAVVIRIMIRCRLRRAQQCDNVPIIVDAEHLSAARFLVFAVEDDLPWQLSILIRRTAEEFDYGFQLEVNYNIDMHAELQFYEPGIY